MKKLIFAVAAVSFLVSCSPSGGNKGVLKMEEGVERYDDEHAEASSHVEKKDSAEVEKSAETVEAKVDSATHN